MTGGRDYRKSFMTKPSASNYDDVVYRSDSSADLLWRAEAAILRSLAREMLRGRKHASYLDFACGTGRVLSLLEDLPESALGIDISSAMLQRARARCKRASLLCKDLTQPGVEVEGRYDLITAFRFVTNAEPPLRTLALRELHKRVKDDGILLINTHGNPWSYRLFLLPYHWLRDRLRGNKFFGYLSNRAVRRELDAAGFKVQRVIGMGFVPGKLLPAIPTRLALAIEKWFAGKPFIQRFGLNQLFVCIKKQT